MVENSFTERRVVASKACLPTSLTNGVHLDVLYLKAKGKLTRSYSTNLHILIIASRQN